MPIYSSTNPSAGWTDPFADDSAALARIRARNTTATSGGAASRPAAPANNYSAAPGGTYADPFSMAGGAGQIAQNTAVSNMGAAANNTRLADLINATNQAAQQAANAGRLGPQGQQIQANSLTNIERASAGLLDPQTETMLRSGINENFGGGDVDSPALAAAYRLATRKTIESTEADAEKRYINMLAANPAAPIYNMGELMMNPATYAGAASAEAGRQLTAQEAALARQQQSYESSLARQQQQDLFYAAQAEAAQRAQDTLAYQYYAANLAAAGRGGGNVAGPEGTRTLSAADYNSSPSGGGGSRVQPAANPFTGNTASTGTETSGGFNNYWNTGGYSDTGAPNFAWDSSLGGYVDTATGAVVYGGDQNASGSVYDWAPSDYENTPVATEPTWYDAGDGFEFY